MKAFKLIPVLFLFLLGSCSSIKVNSDYDQSVDFSQYKTYAFHKRGVDRVEISGLDKKRILNAIDTELSKKGMIKSDNPDLLVNIFTKERERIDVNQYNAGWGYGWGYGWNPYLWGGRTYVSSYVEGTLYIDLIDAKKKELIWEGEGVGYLTEDRERKEIKINEFVAKILAQFPPK
ncbi:DUF4136 domain-containing protein [Flavobacterium sp. ALD4]|jgi:hypothetical protein|uniref:DUF4136 domain-containing protein n=1 Tax=Flavobacterium sp. ALD4 TaxID=2058314 RepID=UPI000C343F0D|nr:DUF4136 domain-containing protein [Flavobacterium sp. ALD4]PKH66220.1 DUF4136 domain-containing protein [Flavobacterium sp. ALD4]|tara:strand:- start:22 stop:549 length:528 start_codon:yes stop_codon:yes gene_type:complete